MNWDDVRVMLGVARHGAVRPAARDLRVHHATVLRRIDQLEADLGVRLFDRTPDGYVLTSAGEDLQDAATRVEADLLSVERRIEGTDHALAGTVRVTMPEPLATRIFLPQLPELQSTYPRLNITVITTNDMLDLARMEADIAIRANNNPPNDLVGRRLFKYGAAIYASRDYLQDHDPVGEPQDARWLGWEDQDTEPAWIAQTPFPSVPVGVRCPGLTAQHAAAEAGLGLSYLPCIVGDASPALMRVPPSEPTPARDIWVLTHEDRKRQARIRAVMDFAIDILIEGRTAIEGRPD